MERKIVNMLWNTIRVTFYNSYHTSEEVMSKYMGDY